MSTPDLSLLTSDALLDIIQPEVSIEQRFVIEELRRRLNAVEESVFVLPVSVSDAIRSYFGGGRQTFEAMAKRVQFAYQVWQGKYGPWSLDQAEYAESVVLFCINKAAHGSTPAHARALVYTWLDKAVNHENTHEGFKLRAEEGIDITDVLREVA